MKWLDLSIVGIYILREMIKMSVLDAAIFQDFLKLYNIKTAWRQVLTLVE